MNVRLTVRWTLALAVGGLVGCANMLDQNRVAPTTAAVVPTTATAVAETPPTAPVMAVTPTTEPSMATTPTTAPTVVMPVTTPSAVAVVPTTEPGTTMPATAAVSMPAPPPVPASTEPSPTVATGELGQPQPLPGLTPPPKPFIAMGRHAPPPPSAQPSPLLLEHAAPDAPVPLSVYGSQPTHAVADFNLGPDLTGVSLQARFGPPAGVAGIEDPWLVYRLTHDRELWLHFAGGDGPLLAADLVRAAENGYVRDRLYPR